MLILQLLQHFLRGDILTCFCLLGLLDNLEFIEQNFTHLFGRCNIKMFASQHIDTLFDFIHSSGKLFAGFSQRLCIQTDTIHLHFSQNRHQRHLYIIKEVFAIILLQFWFKFVFQLQRDVSILASILIDEGRREVTHRLLSFSFWTNQLIDMDSLIVQIHLSHIIHIVTKFWLDEIVGYHRVPHLTFQFDVIISQHLEIVLQILSNLQNMLVFIERFKDINNSQRFFTIGRNGHIKCLMFLYREAQTHQFCINCRG